MTANSTLASYQPRHKELQQAVVDARRSSDKTILLEAGDYFLEQPLQLGPEDSGLTISAASGARVSLYGGKPITGWRQRDERLWSAPIAGDSASGEGSDDKGSGWDFRMLLVNGRLADRSRLPETGYFLHESDFDVKWLSTVEGGWERPPTDDELLTLRYRPEDIGEWFDTNNAELTIFHMWDESLVGVADIDRDNHTIRFSNKPGYPPAAFAEQYSMERRYVVWNLEAGIHRPGQWYLDRTAGEVVYWPLPGEDMQEAAVIAPTAENVIRVEGTAEKPVTDIEIRNLAISVSNAPLMTGAFGAKLFDAAISMDHADNCRLVNLEICNVGAHAIRVFGDRLTVKDCEVHHCGASAIRHVGSHSEICNNEIHHVGAVFPSAIALYVGCTDPNEKEEYEFGKNCSGVTIANNELHDTPYTAIACGGKRHRIVSNLIYRAMQDLYDGAGIYTTFCEEIEIRGNFVRDINESPGAGTSAYYLDEHSTRCTVEGNLEINVARPMHNHISTDNTIINNVFVIKGSGRLTIERSSGYVFEKNIIVADGDFELLDMRACKEFSNNILHCREGELTTHELEHYTITATYPLPLGETNRDSDPGLASYEQGQVVFTEDSIAPSLGIRPINVSDAGLTHRRESPSKR
ncbi:MAG: right-handed parallel beta-helix repeat-containing protein [Planctomycetota bacterium]